MDREARRRACVELRVKLSRDAGTNLTAAFCEALLDLTVECEGGEQVSLQGNPGLFYAGLGAAIAEQTLALVLPNHLKVAWCCYREAAEVHTNPVGMRKLAFCYNTGRGVNRTLRSLLLGFRRPRTWGTPPPEPSSALSL